MSAYIDYTLTPHETDLWNGTDVDSAIFRTATLATARGIANRERKTVLLSLQGEDGRLYLGRAVSHDWFAREALEPALTPRQGTADWQL